MSAPGKTRSSVGADAIVSQLKEALRINNQLRTDEKSLLHPMRAVLSNESSTTRKAMP